jgi:hypothetical protein
MSEHNPKLFPAPAQRPSSPVTVMVLEEHKTAVDESGFAGTICYRFSDPSKAKQNRNQA